MLCNQCKRYIDQEEGSLIPPAADGSSPAFCGYCGSDDLSHTYTCTACGHEFLQKDMSTDMPGVCNVCEEDLNNIIEQQAAMHDLSRIAELTHPVC